MTNGIQHTGKFLLISGLIIAVIGGLLMFSVKIPWLGKLPGDILIRKENYIFYFPLATGIVISIILSFLFRLFGRR